MNIIKLVFLCLLMLPDSGNYKEQICEQNKLKITIHGLYQYKIEKDDESYQDFFTVQNPDSSVKYLINIVKVKSLIESYNYLKTEEYKNNFSDSTSTITEVKEITYSSFKGIRFLKRIVSQERTFQSYSICTIIDGNLLIVTYSTIENNFYKYENEFNTTVNSIKFM